MLIFKISSISGFSSLLFEPILRYAGFFWTKLAMSVMTTGGAVLLAFYKDNNDLIIWAWNLMGFPSVMYIILNINEQAPRFPSISGLTIGNGTDITLSSASLALPLLNLLVPLVTLIVAYGGLSTFMSTRFCIIVKVLLTVSMTLLLVYSLHSNSYMTPMLVCH